MKYQYKLDEIRENLENGRFCLVPTQAQLDTVQRVTQAPIDSRQAENALEAGDFAPKFSLWDMAGMTVSSRALLAQGPLVVIFYRGVWRPYCNHDLRALADIRPEIKTRGARLIAISPQTPANSLKSQHESNLGFPILSDAGAAVAADFDLRFSLLKDLTEIYKQFGNDLAKINSDASWVLPMPARYVIGTDGVIAYAEVNPDYTRCPAPSELLPVLDRIRGRALA